MTTDYKIQTGKLGEQIAARFLKSKGAKIIDRRFYTRYGEIDLIAKLGDEILFVEVKSRSSHGYGYPEISVDSRKVGRLLKAITVYIREKRIDQFWRLDAVAVELDYKNKRAKVRWFKDVGREI